MATVLENLKIYLGMDIADTSKDGRLSLFLSMADNKILNKRYPFGYTDTDKANALLKYSDIELEIAVYLWNKIGAEGQTSHNENGINRGYESAGIPDSFVKDIVPMCKAF